MLSCVQLIGHPTDCSAPGSSIHGIFQERILEWVVISSSRISSRQQGLNPHLLCLQHWYVDSLPLDHLGSSIILTLAGEQVIFCLPFAGKHSWLDSKMSLWHAYYYKQIGRRTLEKRTQHGFLDIR